MSHTDWGVGFYGHWSQATSHLVCDPHLGWLCFNCDLVRSDPALSRLYRSAGHRQYGHCTVSSTHVLEFQPRDAFRTRVFVAPLALLVSVDGAWVESVIWDVRGRRLEVQLQPQDVSDGAAPGSPEAVLADQVMAAARKKAAMPIARLLVERTAQGTMMAVGGSVSVQKCPGGKAGSSSGAAACTAARVCHTTRPNTSCVTVGLPDEGTRAVINW